MTGKTDRSETALPMALQKTVIPRRDALRIILLYLVMGLLWILFSDRLLGLFAGDLAIYQKLQLWKGWLYIFLSGALFYGILVHKLRLIRIASDTIIQDNLRLQRIAYHDPLTQLPNKLQLTEKGQEALRLADLGQVKAAFCYLDIDNFKHINETLGHEAGDRLLCHLATQMIKRTEPRLTFYRLSGNEFVCLIMDIQDADDASAQIRQIMAQLSEPWSYEEQCFHMTLSAGIAIFPEHGSTVNQLLQSADAALSHVKDRGKNDLVIFNETMRESSWNYIRLYNGLQNALNQSSFQLFFQPIIELRTQQIVSLEALIRWPDSARGFIPPMEFIPFAESTGQIIPITSWVIRQVCALCQLRQQQGLPILPVAINLSGNLLTQSRFIPQLEDIIRESGLDCRNIEFEITETAAVRDFEQTVRVLGQLKDMGFKIALDDFGTGYSSLTYLRKLPIDRIKIDRTFIMDITTLENQQTIFQSIVNLAHNLKLKVVAEGVETAVQLDFLKTCGCDEGQGYYIARPMPETKLDDWLSEPDGILVH